MMFSQEELILNFAILSFMIILLFYDLLGSNLNII